jgi:hypothetical protein
VSRLTELIGQAKAKDHQLGEDLDREFRALSSRRAFGLNFERHRPEVVELPQRPIRKGDKVRVLPERGSKKSGDQRLWLVKSITENDSSIAEIELLISEDREMRRVSIDDLVVVAEFRDFIYPGLVSTGKVDRGGNKPFHTVINGENFHALKALKHPAAVAGLVTLAAPPAAVPFLIAVDRAICCELLPNPPPCCSAEANNDTGIQRPQHGIMNRPACFEQRALVLAQRRFGR